MYFESITPTNGSDAVFSAQFANLQAWRIGGYLTETIAKYCNFGDTLEKMLWDQLAHGINNDGIQKSY